MCGKAVDEDQVDNDGGEDMQYADYDNEDGGAVGGSRGPGGFRRREWASTREEEEEEKKARDHHASVRATIRECEYVGKGESARCSSQKDKVGGDAFGGASSDNAVVLRKIRYKDTDEYEA
ncbi:MAG: hypothetical protein Q9218_001763 [Villophora microphyllina]